MKGDTTFNFTVNVADGAFFGLALGAASSVAILPLFVAELTDSAVLLGLIPSIHVIGWQLPQLLTSGWVSGLRRFKPLVLFMSVHERLPFFGLAVVAWLLPVLDRKLALVLIFMLLIWQGLGGGFTATAWQSMIAKIIPPRRHGIFFGIQASAANLFASGGALAASTLLQRLPSPSDYSAIFGLAGVSMAISWFALSLTRETPSLLDPDRRQGIQLWGEIRRILNNDINFRRFLLARVLIQIATMASAFFTIYAVRELAMDAPTAGLMAGVFSAVQIVGNPVLGWLGDRWGHRLAMEIGVIAAVLSALLAWWAPVAGWFYLVFALAGLANVAFWTTVIAMTLGFGSTSDRPAYIGLANTLIAPATFLAPILGGWLADIFGFQTTFLVSAFGGGLAAILLHWGVKAPVGSGSRHTISVHGD